MFPDKLSGHGKSCLLNRVNLTQPIQMQLSRKAKSFSHFLSAVLKSSLNFEHFFKKDDSYSCGSSEITECENQG